MHVVFPVLHRRSSCNANRLHLRVRLCPTNPIRQAPSAANRATEHDNWSSFHISRSLIIVLFQYSWLLREDHYSFDELNFFPQEFGISQDIIQVWYPNKVYDVRSINKEMNELEKWGIRIFEDDCQWQRHYDWNRGEGKGEEIIALCDTLWNRYIALHCMCVVVFKLQPVNLPFLTVRLIAIKRMIALWSSVIDDYRAKPIIHFLSLRLLQRFKSRLGLPSHRTVSPKRGRIASRSVHCFRFNSIFHRISFFSTF